MREIIKAMYENTAEYFGTSVYLMLAIMAGVFLMFTDRKKYSRIILSSIIALFVMFNPVLYKYVFAKIRFWRLFWILPLVYIILLAVMELYKKCSTLQWKVGLTVLMILMLMAGGNNVFKVSGKGKNTGIYRLPKGVVEACDAMLKLDSTPRPVTGGNLRTTVRQYAPEIEPMYGRDTENYIDKANEYEKRIYKEMESTDPDYAYILSNARRLGYDFVVNTSDKPIDYEVMKAYGYNLISDQGGYNVYYNPVADGVSGDYTWKQNGTGWYCLDSSGNRLKATKEEIDGVWYYFNDRGFLVESLTSETVAAMEPDDLIVTCYSNRSPAHKDEEAFLYTVDDQKGGYIVIDGGSKSQYKTAHDDIKKYGRDITAWIITGDIDYKTEDVEGNEAAEEKNESAEKNEKTGEKEEISFKALKNSGAFRKIYKEFVKDTASGKSDAHPIELGAVYAPEGFENEKFTELTEGDEKVQRIEIGETFTVGAVELKFDQSGKLVISGNEEKLTVPVNIENGSAYGTSYILK